MARPSKAGLEYFPLDVEFDDEVDLLEAKHGIVGFGVLIKLYQHIYKAGYFFNASEDRLLLFKKRVDVDIDTVNAVINDCLRWKIFDKNLFEKFGILTSRGVQKRYVEATKRRTEVELVKEYVLIENIEDRYPKKVNVHIYSINADIVDTSSKHNANINNRPSGVDAHRNEGEKINVDKNPKNADIVYTSSKHDAGINSQSKVKESKVKKSKIIPDQPPAVKSELNPHCPTGPPPPGISFKDLKSKLKNKQVMSKNSGKRLDEYFQGINQACDKITALPKKKKQFDPFKWAQRQVSKSQHPGAIMESLEGLAMFWDSAQDPWAYALNILGKKNGTFNEQEAVAYHEELKNMKNSQLKFLTQGLLQEMPT